MMPMFRDTAVVPRQILPRVCRHIKDQLRPTFPDARSVTVTWRLRDDARAAQNFDFCNDFSAIHVSFATILLRIESKPQK